MYRELSVVTLPIVVTALSRLSPRGSSVAVTGWFCFGLYLGGICTSIVRVYAMGIFDPKFTPRLAFEVNVLADALIAVVTSLLLAFLLWIARRVWAIDLTQKGPAFALGGATIRMALEALATFKLILYRDIWAWCLFGAILAVFSAILLVKRGVSVSEGGGRRG